jgi:two-component system alkaline phosphatase synthesis response regulator PhoP
MSIKILIVDDDYGIRMLLQNIFSEVPSFEVSEASSGKEALEKGVECKPDIIILDIMLPEMDGYQVCERIRSHYQLKDAYIIMLSAKHQDADIKRAIDADTDEYITKPFEADDFRTHILWVARAIQRNEEIKPSFVERHDFVHYIKGKIIKR